MFSLAIKVAGIVALAAAFTTAPSVAQAAPQLLSFKGTHFVVGSAAAKARAIQDATGPNVVYWPARGALFVADPQLNGVMVYDETKGGANVTPYGILAGPNTALDGPVAVATGSDLPCTSSGCTPYVWVANAGNQTITYYTTPLTAWNQAPTATISWNGNPYCNGAYGPLGSTSPLQFPYGIVHYWFPQASSFSNPQGQLFQTSEANVSGNYWLNAWAGSDSGPSQCLEAWSTNLNSPSGPSVLVDSPFIITIFNANTTQVTATDYDGDHWVPHQLPYWTVGPGACTEGTAVEPGSNAKTTFVWATTNAGCKYPKSDALWSCSLYVFGGTNGCPSAPQCMNPQAKLDFPVLPGFSPLTNRLYVPNQNNGTVTAYTLRGDGTARCRPKSVYVNTQMPLGVALQF